MNHQSYPAASPLIASQSQPHAPPLRVYCRDNPCQPRAKLYEDMKTNLPACFRNPAPRFFSSSPCTSSLSARPSPASIFTRPPALRRLAVCAPVLVDGRAARRFLRLRTGRACVCAPPHYRAKRSPGYYTRPCGTKHAIRDAHHVFR